MKTALDGWAWLSGEMTSSSARGQRAETTWLQMMCALLIFQDPRLPATLTELSPWLDWTGTPIDQVLEVLAAQKHRRFIKTHTPLDGIPVEESVYYVVVARDPLDIAVSLYHHGDNLDRARIRELTGQGIDPDAPRPGLHDWLVSWIDWDGDPRRTLDSLPGVAHHLVDAWARREEQRVLLFHYQDLVDDLEGEMRRLADLLQIVVPEARWPELVRAASFDQMRRRAEELAPDPAGIIKSPVGFFRRGTSGAGGEVLSADESAHYRARLRGLLSPQLFDWLVRSAP